MKSSQTDVVIIGAGVIGSSIAYHLAQEKLDVILLESGDIASGSSGACDGMVFLQSKRAGIHLDLAIESRRRFGRLAQMLPVPIGYQETGGMIVIETEDELAAMHSFVDQQRAGGLEISLLDADRARGLEPHLGDHILGATHSPLDGQVNPIALTLGFALGAKSRGVRVATKAAVHGIELKAGRVVAVETASERFETDIVINAAGAHAGDIGAMVGLTIPIRPRRGQIIVTETCPPIITHCMITAKYLSAKYNSRITTTDGEGASIEQTENGNFLLGSTREFAGFHRQTTPAGLQRIAATTTSLIPALKNVNVIRSFSGLRPHTPDGLPILGPVEQIPGFIMAAGHEGDGIALAPITGELIAQIVARGGSDRSLDAFRLERFNGNGQNKKADHD